MTQRLSMSSNLFSSTKALERERAEMISLFPRQANYVCTSTLTRVPHSFPRESVLPLRDG
jgi:hypothetical protein